MAEDYSDDQLEYYIPPPTVVYPTEFASIKENGKNSVRYLNNTVIEVKANLGGEELSFITDAKHINLVRTCTWYICRNKYRTYVATTVDKKSAMFSRLVTKYRIVNYKNGCSLDLREINMIEREDKMYGRLYKSEERALTKVKWLKDSRQWVVGWLNGTQIKEELFPAMVYGSKTKAKEAANKFKDEKFTQIKDMFNEENKKMELGEIIQSILDYKSDPIWRDKRKKINQFVYPTKFTTTKQKQTAVNNQEGTHYEIKVKTKDGGTEKLYVNISECKSEEQAKAFAEGRAMRINMELGIPVNRMRYASVDTLQVEAPFGTETLTFVTDDINLDIVKKHTWYIKEVDGQPYVYRKNRQREEIMFHSEAKKLVVEQKIYHKNGCTLDNRVKNLVLSESEVATEREPFEKVIRDILAQNAMWCPGEGNFTQAGLAGEIIRKKKESAYNRVKDKFTKARATKRLKPNPVQFHVDWFTGVSEEPKEQS